MILDVQAIVNIIWLLYYLDFAYLPLALLTFLWLLKDALLALVDMRRLLFLI